VGETGKEEGRCKKRTSCDPPKRKKECGEMTNTKEYRAKGQTSYRQKGETAAHRSTSKGKTIDSIKRGDKHRKDHNRGKKLPCG